MRAAIAFDADPRQRLVRVARDSAPIRPMLENSMRDNAAHRWDGELKTACTERGGKICRTKCHYVLSTESLIKRPKRNYLSELSNIYTAAVPLRDSG